MSMTISPKAQGRILEAISAAAPKPVAKAVERDLEWEHIDPATLPPAFAKLYAAKQEADAIARECRETFEAALRAAVTAPPGEEMIFGYRFGRLSFAFAPKARKTSSPKGALDFASISKR